MHCWIFNLQVARSFIYIEVQLASCGTSVPGPKREIKSVKLNCFPIICPVFSNASGMQSCKGNVDHCWWSDHCRKAGSWDPEVCCSPKQLILPGLRTRRVISPSFILHLRMTGTWLTAKGKAHQCIKRTKGLCDWQSGPKKRKPRKPLVLPPGMALDRDAWNFSP